jgi:hypothetical protein
MHIAHRRRILFIIQTLPLISICGNLGNFGLTAAHIGESFTVEFYSFAQQLLRHRLSARRISAIPPLSIDISRCETLTLTRREIFLHH